MKSWKKIIAGCLCAFLFVQGMPQMLIAMQLPNAGQVKLQGEVQTVDGQEGDAQTMGTGSAGKVESTENAGKEVTAGTAENTEGTENSAGMNHTESVESTEETENTGSSGNVGNTEGAEGTEGTEEVGGTEGTEEVGGTEGAEDGESIEGTEDIESTETVSIEGTEGSEETEETEGTEGSEETEETEETEGTEGSEETEETEETEGTEDVDTTEVPEEKNISINVKLEGNVTGDLQAEYQLGKVKKQLTITTAGAAIEIGAEHEFQLDVLEQNGMIITGVKWGETAKEQVLSGCLDGNTVKLGKDVVAAAKDGYTLIICVDYHLRVQLTSDIDDLEEICLNGTAEVTEDRQKSFTLQGTGTSGVPLSLDGERNLHIRFADMQGLVIDGIKVQGDSEIKEEDGDIECVSVDTICLNEDAINKISSGTYTLVITVRFTNTFIVSYKDGEFVEPGKTLLNKKYGKVSFESDENGKKKYLVVESTGSYFSKQICLADEPEAQKKITPDESASRVESVRFSVPLYSHNSGRLTIQMVEDNDKPKVEVEGTTLKEGYGLVLYRKGTDEYDIAMRTTDAGSGVASVKYNYDDGVQRPATRDSINKDMWIIKSVNVDRIKDLTIQVADYYNNTVTVLVRIIVDSEPPQIKSDTIEQEGIYSIKGIKGIDYWIQTGEKVALTFDASEENGPITADYTLYTVLNGDEQVVGNTVTCELEDLETDIKASGVSTEAISGEENIKMVPVAELASAEQVEKDFEPRRLTFDFQEMFRGTADENRVSFNDLPDGEYIIRAAFNDATQNNRTGEMELAHFIISKGKPVIRPEDNGGEVHWIHDAAEPITVTADAEVQNYIEEMKYAVTYVTGEEADAILSEEEIPVPGEEDWIEIGEDKITSEDGIVQACGIEYELPVQQMPEGTVKFYLWIQDGVWNMTHSAPIIYNIDNTTPSYGNFKVTEKLNPAQRIFRHVFGTFLNGRETLSLSIDVTDPCPEGAVYAAEENQGDGQPRVSGVKLYYVDDAVSEESGMDSDEAYEWLQKNSVKAQEIEAAKRQGDTYTFELAVDEENKFYRLYFAAEDVAGNRAVANVAALDDGSGKYQITKYMVDDKKPVIVNQLQTESAKADYETKNGNKTIRWYAGDRDIAYDVAVTDEQSGIFSVKTSINGEELAADANGAAFYDGNTFYKQNKADSMERETGFSYVVKPEQGSIAEDGSYTIAVEAADNAGNFGEVSDVIYVDLDQPVITHMEFDSGNRDELNTVPMQYGYFFQEATRVTVYATDYIGESQMMGSGVAKFCYKLNPADGKAEICGELEPVRQEDGTSLAQFTVPAGFKGQIEANVVDNVGQESGYYNPKGAVVESPEEHKKTSSAEIALPETDRRDSEGNPLYGADITMKFTVADSRSGLKQNDWSVNSYYGSEPLKAGTLQISSEYNEGSKTWKSVLSGDTDWSIPDNLDLNLVTKAEKEVTVSSDANHITADLAITDHAGNTSAAKRQVFSIDKSAPVIEVEYDNNDSLNTRYYKEKRVATVTVTDANFSEDDCYFDITGPAAAISEWAHRPGDGCNGTVHTGACAYSCNVEFSEDGDYKFGFRCVDLAGNSAKYDFVDEFTIDTKEPVITVSYDNNNSSGGIYYNAARRATIEIEDTNFDPAETAVNVTAAIEGGTVAAPQVSAFTQSGDVWRASLNFSEDGDYSLQVTSTDKAGNRAEEYALEEFTVDMTEPEITIEGVADHSANKGVVSPVIRFADINMDDSSLYLHLTGANHGETAFESTRTVTGNSIQIAMADFKYEADADDLYTLEVGAADRAGNETVETVVFSVNRFGSVYILEDATKNLVENFYTNKEQDIVVTEVNVDTLQFEEIDYSLDGDIVTLQKGSDYSVTSKADDAGWKMYEYRIDKKNFEREGSYVVSIYSEDLAQNRSSNKAKGKELAFVVDKTAPSIVVAGVENYGQYMDASRNITVDTQDNILLDRVEVYVGNERRTSAGQEELLESNGQVTLALAGANQAQELYVVAEDAAGNVTRSENIRFLITKNLFVQWYSNIPLCVGSTTVTVGAGGFLLFRKRILFRRV